MLSPLSYDHFVDTLLYRRDSLNSKDDKAFINSRKLKKRVLESHNNNDHAYGLIVRGRNK